MDTQTALDPFEIPQGTEAGDITWSGGGGHGFTIGSGGTGGECGHLQALGYLERANHEVANRFRNDPTINRHEFFVRVRLWFNSTGSVRQTEFENSTGDGQLDEVVTALLRTIDLKEKVPECIQPITVQIVSPWNARSGKVGDGQANPKTQSSETLIWQHPHAQ